MKTTRGRLEVDEKATVEARAHKGQINRCRVLEFELGRARNESKARLDERNAAVKKAEDLTQLLNVERAQRLRDMHATFREAADNVNASRELKKFEKKFYAQQSELESVLDRCAALEAAFDAHTRVTQRSLDAHDEQLIEMERHKANILFLKKSLFDAEEHHDRLQVVVEAQRSEIDSLRTQIIRIAKTNSQRTLNCLPERAAATLASRIKMSDDISAAAYRMPLLDRFSFDVDPQLDDLYAKNVQSGVSTSSS